MTDHPEKSLAMVLRGARQALQAEQRPLPEPGAGQVRLRVRACAVCRTDLHLQDGDLPMARWPVVPGHEIVGTVEALGAGVEALRVGQRVGVPWLGGCCGRCRYCLAGQENLCDAPEFTGCTRDGGFATHVVANASFCVPLDHLALDDATAAPLLCAGLIGWRSLRMAGDDARVLGLYGFGAAAHLIAQVAIAQGRRVHAFTRAGDTAAQQHALASAGDNSEFTRDVGQPVALAIHAFGKGDYTETVRLLRPIRHIAHRFGGSHAQRDAIDLTLVEATIRSGNSALSRALAAERFHARPDSPLSKLFVRRAEILPNEIKKHH